MKLNRPLVPGFLRKTEHSWLINRPLIWSTRAHHVLYYGALMIALITAVSFAVPDDPRTRSNVHYWIMFVTVVSILFLTVWLIYLLRFNVFKRYGTVSGGATLVEFVLYFICAAVIVLMNFVQPYVESARANAKYGDRELIDDVNTLNVNINLLEYDSISHVWSESRILIVDSARAAESSRRQNGEDVVASSVDTVVLQPKVPSILMDSADFAVELKKADSIVRINDSTYTKYECPDYIFIHTYLTNKLEGSLLSSVEIYRQYLANYNASSLDKKKLASETRALIDKYTGGLPSYSYYYDENGYRAQIDKTYSVGMLNTSIWNTGDRKFRFDPPYLSLLVRMFYYFTLVITLMVFVFRHTTVRAFFLSLLTAVLLSVFTGLVMAFADYSGIAFMSWLLFLFVLFLVLALFTWRSESRRYITGIPLNLFVLMLPFMPLIGVSLYYEVLDRNTFEDVGRNIDYLTYLDNKSFYMQMAEYAGAGLLLILVPTFIYAAYRKWYALPEE